DNRHSADLDSSCPPASDSDCDPDQRNVYYRSKNDSEKLAWELADKYGLDMVSVLPGTMIGSECHRLSMSYEVFKTILDKKLFADTQFFFHWVDVKDVAMGCWQAMNQGRSGQRYILANEHPTGLQEIVQAAQEMYPELGLKTPPRMPRFALYTSAFFYELMAQITQKEPLMMRNHVQMYFQMRHHLDMSNSITDLGYAPKSAQKAIRDALAYLMAHRSRFW
ncbi:MAG: NAD-dependent epimerase/dehydratase family protein, partial [Bacteroidota bacterium]